MEENIILQELEAILQKISDERLFNDAIINLEIGYPHIDHKSDIDSGYDKNGKLIAEFFYRKSSYDMIDHVNTSGVLDQIISYDLNIFTDISLSDMSNEEIKRYFSKYYNRYNIKIRNERDRDELDKDRVSIDFISPYLSNKLFFDECDIDKIHTIYSSLLVSSRSIYKCLKS